MFVTMADDCDSGGGITYIPNPGFSLVCQRSHNDYETVLPYSRTYGAIGRSYFGYLIGVADNATGKFDTFDVTAGSYGRADVNNNIAPAFYHVEARANWLECTGLSTGASIDRGVFNYLTCIIKDGTGSFGGPTIPNSIDTTSSPTQITAYGEGIDSQYGMPTFQFFNQFGTLIAQSPATAVDQQDHLWASTTTNNLVGLPTGPYGVKVLNVTPNGPGTIVSTANLYVYGGPIQKVIDDASFFVRQQYLDFLGHEPDQATWELWTNQILQCGTDTTCINDRRAEAAKALWYSNEFLQLHPGLRNPSGVFPDFNNQEFVRLCYVLYMQRDPDQSGYDFWTANLNASNDYKGVIRGFIESPEYRTRFDPPPPSDPVGCNPTPEQVSNCENCCSVRAVWDYDSCSCMVY